MTPFNRCLESPNDAEVVCSARNSLPTTEGLIEDSRSVFFLAAFSQSVVDLLTIDSNSGSVRSDIASTFPFDLPASGQFGVAFFSDRESSVPR